MISKRNFNRPIAPHLLIYKPQDSSLTSIWQRFSGLYILINLIIFLTFIKFNSLLIFNYFLFFINLNKITTFIYFTFLINFLFHFMKGSLYFLTWKN